MAQDAQEVKDQRKRDFVLIHQRIRDYVRDGVMDHKVYLVYAAYLHYAEFATGDGVWVSLDRIARDMRLHRDWVRWGLQCMEALGLVRVTRRPGRTTLLAFLDPPAWTDRRPQMPPSPAAWHARPAAGATPNPAAGATPNPAAGSLPRPKYQDPSTSGSGSRSEAKLPDPTSTRARPAGPPRVDVPAIRAEIRSRLGMEVGGDVGAGRIPAAAATRLRAGQGPVHVAAVLAQRVRPGPSQSQEQSGS